MAVFLVNIEWRKGATHSYKTVFLRKKIHFWEMLEMQLTGKYRSCLEVSLSVDSPMLVLRNSKAFCRAKLHWRICHLSVTVNRNNMCSHIKWFINIWISWLLFKSNPLLTSLVQILYLLVRSTCLHFRTSNLSLDSVYHTGIFI